MSKHTSGPWYAKEGMIASLSDPTGRTIATCDEQADAEFIAKAMNCHEELLEACKVVVGLLEAMHEVPPTRAKKLRAAIRNAENIS